MFNKRSSNNFDNIDLNNLKNYKNSNYGEENEDNNNNYQIPNQPSKISSKNDVPIIKEMMELDPHFMLLMKNRVNGLNSVTNSYKNGRLENAIDQVGESKDLGLINDFFRYAIIKKDTNKVNLNIDMSLRILPNILKMVNSKYDPYFKTSISTIWIILNYYSDQIMEVIKTPVFNRVDINREERINKYKKFVDYF
jgi:hypothetical protein